MKSLNILFLLGFTLPTLLSTLTFSMILIPSDTPTGAYGSGPDGGASGINGYRTEGHNAINGKSNKKSYSMRAYVEGFGLPASEYYPGDAGYEDAVTARTVEGNVSLLEDHSTADYNRFNIRDEFKIEVQKAINLLNKASQYTERLSFIELLQILNGGTKLNISDFQGIANRKEALDTIKTEVIYLKMELHEMSGRNTTYIAPKAQTTSNLKKFLGNKNRISAKLAQFFKERAILNFQNTASRTESLFAQELNDIVNGANKVKNRCSPLI